MAYFGGVFFVNYGGWGWSELFSKKVLTVPVPILAPGEQQFQLPVDAESVRRPWMQKSGSNAWFEFPVPVRILRHCGHPGFERAGKRQ